MLPAAKQMESCVNGLAIGVAALALLGSTQALAGNTVNFTNVADDPAMGLSYARVPSHLHAARQGIEQASLVNPIPREAVGIAPHRTYGMPGVGLFDYDGDGDLDVYVTNGPGAANSLFSNQLVETGDFSFIDVGAASGAGATSQDSNGVCMGDVDNDGDEDVLVLGRQEANRLLLNNGDGTFTDLAGTGLEGGTTSHTSCSMGDIDGDGLLDVMVGNAFDFSSQLPLVAFPYDNEANLLFHNEGGLLFTDVSETSGIRVLNGLTNAPPDATTITWAVAMVDIDLDGDMDILHGDDQGPVDEDFEGGWDRAFIHVFINDGTGHFIDEVNKTNPNSNGSWMSLDFADLDMDGNMDLFGGNFGDYMAAPFGTSELFTHMATRQHFGNGDGTFEDPGSDRPTPFSWGSTVSDLDNDGDHDAAYHGALDMILIKMQDNPGTVVINDGNGNLSAEIGGFDANYSKLSVQGVAAGDLDQDGFIDVVTASDHTMPADLMPFLSSSQYDDEFDTTALWYALFRPDENGNFVWRQYELEPGRITMEINNGDSGNPSVRVRPHGSVGLTDHGVHNRSGFGAVVTFTPRGRNARTMMQPVTGGSSFLSQHEPVAHFGVPDANAGRVEVMWNGGNRNALFNVRPGDVIDFPEIGCSYDTDDSFGVYYQCVQSELDDLQSQGALSSQQAHRFRTSMILAYYLL